MAIIAVIILAVSIAAASGGDGGERRSSSDAGGSATSSAAPSAYELDAARGDGPYRLPMSVVNALLSNVSAARIEVDLQELTRLPHRAGLPRQRELAEAMQQQWREAGIEVE